jgi:hypothetical protein
MSYDEFFGRNLGIFSAAQQQKLKDARVAIIGCGGIGGVLAVVLARSGIAHFQLMDGDCYEASNMNRQIACFCDTFGRNKAACVKEDILRVNPDAEVIVHERHLLPEDLKDVPDMGDVILPVMDEWPLSLTVLETVRKSKPAVMAYPVGALGRVSVFTAQSPTVAECLVMPYGFGYEQLKEYTSRPDARRLLLYYMTDGQWREEWFDRWVEGKAPHAQIAPIVWITSCLAALETVKVISGRWKPVIAPYYWSVTPTKAGIRKFGLGRKLASRLSRHEWILQHLPELSRSKTLVRLLTRMID